jgi:hypothetical protein
VAKIDSFLLAAYIAMKYSRLILVDLRLIPLERFNGHTVSVLENSVGTNRLTIDADEGMPRLFPSHSLMKELLNGLTYRDVEAVYPTAAPGARVQQNLIRRALHIRSPMK